MANVHVTKSDPPESKEILAAAIVRISAALTKLSSSGMNEAGIVALIHDGTGLSKRDIKTVLDAQKQLAAWYCK
jgi:hypothetical protein